MVSRGSFKKSKLKYNPADAKNRGTKNPSATPRMPGMMSRRIWYGSRERAAPKRSAPREP